MQKLFARILISIICLTANQLAISQHYGILQKGHSHNDYRQKRPLYDALELGFCSIEIDVYVKNERLIVSHLPIFLNQKPDIESLYFQPLSKLTADSLFEKSFQKQPLILMIDIKNEPEKALELLRTKIEMLKNSLCYPNQNCGNNALIQICLSGRKPMSGNFSDSSRYYTIDGSIAGNLNSDLPYSLLQRLSDPLKKHFNSKNKLNKEEEKILQQLVWKAHAKGRQIRFYAAGNHNQLWKQLHHADVDWVNVDKLRRYAEFVQSETKKSN